MNSPLDATAPDRNATVHASAGTGKTWLLVTRLVRLLLTGNQPGHILAVTFTRKAAAEMQDRLTERLRHLATARPPELDRRLEEMGLEATPALRDQARQLYEAFLFADYRLRTTTFHAFCQELLQRFPLEAGVPPGFDLLEAEGSTRLIAWDALYAEATAAPAGDLGQALDRLMDYCGGLGNLQAALDSFLAHRIDWWAFTSERADPAQWAADQLRDQLEIDPAADPARQFFHALQCQRIAEFQALLLRHPIATHQTQADQLVVALDDAANLPDRLTALQQVLLTGTGTPRVRKANKTLAAKLGAAGMERFLTLAEELTTALLDLLDAQQRRDNWLANCAWYRVGERFLHHYQSVKRAQRQLDFSDLEWHAYQLLNRGEHAHWVQYKLDQRIDHLLVDEFQDTNPTQWRLLLPLLEELAAGTSERPRSVFLVGDEKQSIYRFRRADPRLLRTASDWLETRLAAVPFNLARSRRSSQAVIDCVNQVFAHPRLAGQLTDFPRHDTFHTQLHGRVEVLPLIQPREETVPTPGPPAGLRNPLQQPRRLSVDDRFYREGCVIAECIRTLADSPWLIGSAAEARPLRFGDIMILLRNRTHVSDYERALRDAHIPYLGAARGALLNSLEARDLEALLHTLITPHHNLALAQVLRSPLFAASDVDLQQLAGLAQGDWMARLQYLATQTDTSPALVRAARLLCRWREEVGRLPVHDLLDRIFFEGDLLTRYRAATPSVMQPQVLANLQRFLELALEVDSGRYPSLPRFLLHLSQLRVQASEAPDDAPPETGAGDRVRFLTIHSAKGLEAPVVFLADATLGSRDRSAWQAMLDWPADQERPRYFQLNPRRASRDRISQQWLTDQQTAEAREDANLLYVALTRPRQHLFITGTAPRQGRDLGWYGLITESLAPASAAEADTPMVFETGTPPTQAVPTAAMPETPNAIDPRLMQPLQSVARIRRLAPSRQHEVIAAAEDFDEDGRERGKAIHQLLEWLSPPHAIAATAALNHLAGQLCRSTTDSDLQDWLAEAQAVLQCPDSAHLYQEDRYQQAYKETPLHYYAGDILVDGIIDRLVMQSQRILIIDYKTHRIPRAECTTHAAAFRQQMRYYKEGVQRIWPDHELECVILYTHCQHLVPLSFSDMHPD